MSTPVWTVVSGPDRHRRTTAAIENYRRVPQSGVAIVVTRDTTAEDLDGSWLREARTGVSAEYIVATDPSDEVFARLVTMADVQTAILLSLRADTVEDALADLDRRIRAVRPHGYRYTALPLGSDNIHRYPFAVRPQDVLVSG